jgi:hypothetical protein
LEKKNEKPKKKKIKLGKILKNISSPLKRKIIFSSFSIGGSKNS